MSDPRAGEKPSEEEAAKTAEIGDSGFVSGKSISCEDVGSDDEGFAAGNSERFDSGCDLVEPFCKLRLPNDLGTPEESATALSPEETEFWRICFRQNDDGDTHLHIAIANGVLDAVKAIIQMCPLPALLDIRNDAGHAAIHLAVLTSQPHIARRLIIAGAKVNTPDAEGNTALHLASSHGDRKCLKALTEPLIVFPPQQHQQNARTLPQVLDQKNYDVTDLMISDGEPLSAKDNNNGAELFEQNGEACVHLAAMWGHVDILRDLVWYGANINATENKSGRTALHLAAEREDVYLLDFLTRQCPSISLYMRTYAGQTAYKLCGEDTTRQQLLAVGYIRREDDYDLESESESEEDDDNDENNYERIAYFNNGLRGEAINVA